MDNRLTNVILVTAFKPHLQLVILVNDTQKLIKQMRTFALFQAVDILNVMPNGEYALPARNRVGAYNRVSGGKFGAGMKEGTMERVTESSSCDILGGAWLSVGCCQTVEKSLVGWGEAVV